jgi:Helicase associated domain
MVSWDERFAAFVRNKNKGVEGGRGQKKWEIDQRYRVNAGMLCDDKLKRLKDAGFDFEPRAKYTGADDERWMQMFNLLQAYKKKKGTCSVPNSEPKLGVWVGHQRRQMKRPEGLSQRLQNRRALLSDIGFWKDLGIAEFDDSDAGTENPGRAGDTNSQCNDAAEVAPVFNGMNATRVAPALSPGQNTASQGQNLQNLNPHVTGAEFTNIVRDSNSRRNDAEGVVPVINGTNAGTIVALCSGGKQNDQRQFLKRAGNSKSTDRRGKQPRLTSASRVTMEARTPLNAGNAASHDMEREKNKSEPTEDFSLLDTPVQSALKAGPVFASSSSHVGGDEWARVKWQLWLHFIEILPEWCHAWILSNEMNGARMRI